MTKSSNKVRFFKGVKKLLLKSFLVSSSSSVPFKISLWVAEGERSWATDATEECQRGNALCCAAGWICSHCFVSGSQRCNPDNEHSMPQALGMLLTLWCHQVHTKPGALLQKESVGKLKGDYNIPGGTFLLKMKINRTEGLQNKTWNITWSNNCLLLFLCTHQNSYLDKQKSKERQRPVLKVVLSLLIPTALISL